MGRVPARAAGTRNRVPPILRHRRSRNAARQARRRPRLRHRPLEPFPARPRARTGAGRFLRGDLRRPPQSARRAACDLHPGRSATAAVPRRLRRLRPLPRRAAPSAGRCPGGGARPGPVRAGAADLPLFGPRRPAVHVPAVVRRRRPVAARRLAHQQPRVPHRLHLGGDIVPVSAVHRRGHRAAAVRPVALCATL